VLRSCSKELRQSTLLAHSHQDFSQNETKTIIQVTIKQGDAFV
jgi:hypothetical protein